MALKRIVNPKNEEITYSVSSVADAEEAIELMKERNDAIREIEAQMEEEYELSTLRKESMAAYEAVRAFVLKRGKNLVMEDRQFTIVKPAKRAWNPDKLQALLPKSVFVKVATMTYKIDAEKLDSEIRAGKIDRKKIEKAYEEMPSTPYVKHTVKTVDNSQEEADAVAAALDD